MRKVPKSLSKCKNQKSLPSQTGTLNLQPRKGKLFMDGSIPTSTLALERALVSTPQFSSDFHDEEADHLQQQIRQGDFKGLRQFLARTRNNHDWQDRYFILDVVAPAISPGSVDALCTAEPNAADLSLIRGAQLFDLVSKCRGTKTADRTTDQQFAQAQQYANAAIANLRRAIQQDPADPTPHVFAMRSSQVFSDLNKLLQQAYQQAIHVAPDFVPAHFAMVNAQSSKWSGSHEQSLHVARAAMSHFQPRSDAPACIFLAHILVWQYSILFDKDRKRAEAYTNDRKVTQELNDAFELWIRPPYQARRSSLPYLHHAAYWYYNAGDRARLQQALARTGGKPWDKAWVFVGDGRKNYASALEFAATGTKSGSAPEKKSGPFGWFK
jgi:hypothetical protein